MTIEKFTKRPGSPALQSVDDPKMLLITDQVPDTVTLPPELGGGTCRVARAFRGTCPKCGDSHTAPTDTRHLVLENSTIRVAECPRSCGFVWYRMRPQ